MDDGYGGRERPATVGLRAARGPVWSVAALLRAVGDALQARFSSVVVQGELSSFSRAPSGHCYFALKDDRSLEPALIRGAMFRRAAALLDFVPREGQLVEIRGRLAVYDARGDLQLVAEAMRPAGQGALYEQFLRLKARLEAEGLFDPGRKRLLARFPRAVGVVTSLQAAALRDVVTALRRRAPHVRVVVYPTPVQGAEAPAEIERALQLAARRAEVDTLILCRGGGSLEDLWAFNDERVARAVVASPIPVVCGVGHETDFTIADFAADLRAPTPTAAAEMAAPQCADCEEMLGVIARRMHRAVQRRLESQSQKLDHATLRLARPAQALARMRRGLDLLEHRLRAAPVQRLARAGERERHLAARLMRAAAVRRQALAARLEALGARLESANPTRVLRRGYAYLTDEEGRALVSVAQVQVGQAVRAVLADGRLQAQVRDIEPDDGASSVPGQT
ncbi:MAG TPA: exodeoxyribonuclease VII large subunit [Burkholderiaceae bacterium]|nr:exodeoxyribonuclease VII large subunit [Burkholderiaceae bacterium]